MRIVFLKKKAITNTLSLFKKLISFYLMHFLRLTRVNLFIHLQRENVEVQCSRSKSLPYFVEINNNKKVEYYY